MQFPAEFADVREAKRSNGGPAKIDGSRGRKRKCLIGKIGVGKPAEQRARLREMRLSAAAKGLRAPVSGVDCPWLDAVITRDLGRDHAGSIHSARD